MKKLMLMCAIIFSLSTIAAESNQISKELSTDESSRSEIARGFFAGIQMGANAEMDFKISKDGDSISGEVTDAEQKLGFKVGFQDIRYRNAGYIVALNYNQFETGGEETVKFDSVRLDGNIAYGITEQLYVYGGLNLNKFVNDSAVEDYDTGIGFQLGGALAINQSIAIDMNYYQVNNSNEVEGFSIDLETTALELGVNFMF